MIGSFEQLVLLAVVRLGDGAYGMAIRDEIADRTGERPSLGAIYSTLDRLVAKGFLSVSSGPGSASRGGRARKFFELERPGREALEASLQTLEKMLEGTPSRQLETGRT